MSTTATDLRGDLPIRLFEPMFTLSDAAFLSGVPAKSVRNWIARDVLPIGEKHPLLGRWSFSLLDVLRLSVMHDLSVSMQFHPRDAARVAELAARIAMDSTARDGSGALLAGEVLHLRDRVSGGEVVAKSRLQRAAGAVANVGALQEMSLAVWRQGVWPSGYLSTAGFLNDSQRKLMRGLLERFAGTRASGQLMLLEGSTKFEQLGIDAESAQTLESRRFGTEEIARAFQISPLFLQDWSRSTFTNSETAGRWFAQHTLAPWARRLEAAVQGAVLGAHSDVAFELDMSSLLRGSDLERWQMWKLATEIGAVDAAEVRQAESWPPRPAEQQQEPTA